MNETKLKKVRGFLLWDRDPSFYTPLKSQKLGSTSTSINRDFVLDFTGSFIRS